MPFQYISCYSLSRGTLKWAKRNKRFNTSHVTLYRRKHLSNTLQEDLFQYISCYSLSLSTPPEVKQRMSFQYISCYSLSKPHYFPNREMMCFNTSHVTLYPQEKRSRAFGENSFNTSHVTLYQSSSNLGNVRVHVSIHLMLLFIFATLSDSAVMPMFQYISCYSLSSIHSLCFSGRILFQYISCYSLSLFFAKIKTKIFYVSIHLMLLFIRNNSYYPMYEPWFQYISCYSLSERSFRPGKCYHVSIHLMLLFIIKASNEFVKMAKFQYISCYSLSKGRWNLNLRMMRFNTSHVTLYRPAGREGKIVIPFQYISCYSLSKILLTKLIM